VDRIDSYKPRLLQKLMISALQISLFISVMRMIWFPAACHVDMATLRSWRKAPRWARVPLTEEVGAVLGADAIGLGEGRVTRSVGTNDVHGSYCLQPKSSCMLWPENAQRGLWDRNHSYRQPAGGIHFLLMLLSQPPKTSISNCVWKVQRSWILGL